MTFFPPIVVSQFTNHPWSVAALVAANVYPLVGVFTLSWRAFDVVFLYWLENVVIGAVNILKILTCRPESDSSGANVSLFAKLFFAPFFLVHYGLFCFVHGVFVCVLLGGGLASPTFNPFGVATDALGDRGIQIAILGLTVSHLVSYFANFLGKGEYRRLSEANLMELPYGRVVVLHVSLVLSGFFVVTLGSPVWLLVLLITGKTWLDLGLHLREHASSN